MRTAAVSASRDAMPDLPRLRYFGDYELLEEIARGGMGVVYKARQMSLDRVVALKMMRPGLLARPEEVARFRAEAAAAARLHHPNVVTIFEVGEQDGLHYFSMDYVEGANLAEVAGGRPLPDRQAAQYVKSSAEAIEFAHTHGTLHRDLKPSNILIDTDDRPRVTDFGLCLPLKDGSAAESAIAGTPAYMAPEQVAGEPLTAAADVYALGAILHELIRGSRDRDLETICEKCMVRDPRRRYGSAKEFADDLGRYLRREPIRARRIGVAARAWRWVRRNPWQTVAAAALAIAAGEAYRSATMFREQYFQGLLAQARLERATGNLAEAGALVRRAAAIHSNRESLREAVELAVTPGATLLADIPFGWAAEVRFSEDGSRLAARGQGYVGDKRRPPDQGDVVKVWDVATGRLLPAETRWPRAAPPGSTSPDGRLAAALEAHGSQGELVISDVATGQRVATLADNHSPVWSAGGLLATIGGNRVATRDGSMGATRSVAPGVVMGSSRVRVWRITNAAPSYTVGRTVRKIVVSGDGQRLTVNGADWQMGRDGLRHVVDSGTLAQSPDGRRSAVAAWTHGKVDGEVELWGSQRIATLDAVVRPWPDGGAAFSPDGKLLAIQETHVQNDLKIFEAEAGKYQRTIRVKSRLRAFAFLDARHIVCVGSGAMIVDVETGEQVRSWAAGTMEAQDRAVAATGRKIASAGEDRMIHLWDLEGHEITSWTAHAAEVSALTFNPEGNVLYSGAEDGTLRVWDLRQIRAETARLGVTW
jgi:WD40 repeat protein